MECVFIGMGKTILIDFHNSFLLKTQMYIRINQDIIQLNIQVQLMIFSNNMFAYFCLATVTTTTIYV